MTDEEKSREFERGRKAERAAIVRWMLTDGYTGFAPGILAGEHLAPRMDKEKSKRSQSWEMVDQLEAEVANG